MILMPLKLKKQQNLFNQSHKVQVIQLVIYVIWACTDILMFSQKMMSRNLAWDQYASGLKFI